MLPFRLQCGHGYQSASIIHVWFNDFNHVHVDVHVDECMYMYMHFYMDL